MAKVTLFVYDESGKIGKGFIEFFDEKSFKSFLKTGGNLTFRHVEGDDSASVKFSKKSK